MKRRDHYPDFSKFSEKVKGKRKTNYKERGKIFLENSEKILRKIYLVNSTKILETF